MSSIVLNQMLQRGVIVALLTLAAPVRAEWIWVEGEQPSRATVNRHPWYDQVKREELSGGDFISNFNEQKAGEAEYTFKVNESGQYDFWVRANPVQARLSYRLGDGPLDADRSERADRWQRKYCRRWKTGPAVPGLGQSRKYCCAVDRP